MFSRNKIATLVAEFLGTGLLTLIIVAVQRSTIGIPYFIGIAAGLAAGLLVLMFNKASGAVLNPALTLALWTARRLSTVAAVLYIVAQMLGAYLAGVLYSYLVDSDVAQISHDFASRVLVAEAVGTAVLAMAFAAAVYYGYSEAKKAVLYAGGFTLGIMVTASASAGILNPAVALGVNAWGWTTYVLGPVLGAVIGVNLYGLLFAPAGSVAFKTAPATVAAPTTTKRTATTTKKAAPKKTAPKRKTTAKRK